MVKDIQVRLSNNEAYCRDLGNQIARLTSRIDSTVDESNRDANPGDQNVELELIELSQEDSPNYVGYLNCEEPEILIDELVMCGPMEINPKLEELESHSSSPSTKTLFSQSNRLNPFDSSPVPFFLLSVSGWSSDILRKRSCGKDSLKTSSTERYIISENRKRPSPSSHLHGKKKISIPKWLIGVQNQPQTPTPTISGIADVTLEDDSTDSSSPAAPTTRTAAQIDPVVHAAAPTARTAAQTDPVARTTAPITRTTAPTNFTTAPIAQAATPPLTARVVTPTSRSTTPPLIGRVTPPPTSSPPTTAPPTSVLPTAPPTSAPCSSSSLPSSSTTTNFPSSSSEQRLTLRVEGKKIYPSSCPAKILRECFELKLELNGYKITHVSKETQEFYWREFQKRCQWDEVIDSLLKLVYPSFMKEKYRRMVYGLKNKAKIHV
ncbi:flocculation protein FLO11-like [Euphorbia lathyris]|uniref:flocculation protein FLO11-like n=1 Tax=Euphorbia lathyris TaxID=212925 RepID=UPI0033138901